MTHRRRPASPPTAHAAMKTVVAVAHRLYMNMLRPKVLLPLWRVTMTVTPCRSWSIHHLMTRMVPVVAGLVVHHMKMVPRTKRIRRLYSPLTFVRSVMMISACDQKVGEVGMPHLAMDIKIATQLAT